MGTYSFSGSPVFLTVGTTGTYNIAAYGAQGGSGTKAGSFGGLGGKESGTFNLDAGEHLEIIVGGQGVSNAFTGGGGGGPLSSPVQTAALTRP